VVESHHELNLPANSLQQQQRDMLHPVKKTSPKHTLKINDALQALEPSQAEQHKLCSVQ
jgi:hypothetical protein